MNLCFNYPGLIEFVVMNFSEKWRRGGFRHLQKWLQRRRRLLIYMDSTMATGERVSFADAMVKLIYRLYPK